MKSRYLLVLSTKGPTSISFGKEPKCGRGGIRHTLAGLLPGQQVRGRSEQLGRDSGLPRRVQGATREWRKRFQVATNSHVIFVPVNRRANQSINRRQRFISQSRPTNKSITCPRCTPTNFPMYTVVTVSSAPYA